MSSLIDQFRKDEVVEGEVKLTTTTLLSDLEEEYREPLAFLYSSKDIGLRYMATLLNATLTQGRVVFIITRRLMGVLVKEDLNTENKNINNKTYQTMLSRMFTCGYFKLTREPTRKPITPGVKVKAGLLEVIHPKILELLHKTIAEQYLKAQKDVTYKWYDKTNGEEIAVASKYAEHIEKMKSIKEDLREKRIKS